MVFYLQTHLLQRHNAALQELQSLTEKNMWQLKKAGTHAKLFSEKISCVYEFIGEWLVIELVPQENHGDQ